MQVSWKILLVGKKWHGLKITSHNFEVNYNKIAEKKNYDLQNDFGLFLWPNECK